MIFLFVLYFNHSSLMCFSNGIPLQQYLENNSYRIETKFIFLQIKPYKKLALKMCQTSFAEFSKVMIDILLCKFSFNNKIVGTKAGRIKRKHDVVKISAFYSTHTKSKNKYTLLTLLTL